MKCVGINAFLFTYNNTRKYIHATQFEIKVAQPAPAAPIPIPKGIVSAGRMKNGSMIMLRRQPPVSPMLA